MNETNNQTQSELTFVIQHENTISGDLWHTVSQMPQKSQQGDVKTITLGIGRVDGIGRIQAINKQDIDRNILFNFLRNTQLMLKAV